MSVDRVMLLIDADNVSIDVIEQAIAWVHKHYGGPHVRRAYCTAESAVKHQGAFKRLSVRPMVNLAAGKNSTDIALAVDAIDLVVSERPDVVAIASSDSDFAPLVSRLREKGCRVIGVGQGGKVGDETIGVYDDYEVFQHRKAGRATVPGPTASPSPDAPRKARGRRQAAGTGSAAAKARPAAPPTAIPAVPPRVVEAEVLSEVPTELAPPTEPPPAEPLTAKTPARKTTRRRTKKDAPPVEPAAAVPEPAPPPLPDKARAILEALPALSRGEKVELRVAAEKLRELGLLSKSGSSTKLFGQFPELFELQPPTQPNHVKGLPAASHGLR